MSRDDYLNSDKRFSGLAASGFQKSKVLDPKAVRESQNKKRDGEKDAKAKQDEISTKIKTKQQLSLRYRIPSKLKKLEKSDLKRVSHYIGQQMQAHSSDREEYIERLELYRRSWKDFVSAGLNIQREGQHDVHVPTSFNDIKAMHARIYQAVMGIEPPFSIKPLKPVSEKTKKDKEDILQWTLKEYTNKGDGIDEVVDLDIWNFVADGMAITKHSWCRDFRKFQTVEEENKRIEDGKLVYDEKEVEYNDIVYDGPIMEAIRIEDVQIIGNRAEDIDSADMLIHTQSYTKSDVIKMSHQGFFDSDAVDTLISKSPRQINHLTDEVRDVKEQEDSLLGVDRQDALSGKPTYIIDETYLSFDIDKDGIDEELVIWRERDSGLVLRITYLERVSPTGKRPFVLKKFLPIKGTWRALGLAEMLYGLTNLTDYIVNQRLDAGTMQLLPFFFYRATSGLNADVLKLEPGAGIPTDDPTRDVVFPRVNGNVSYGFNEEAQVRGYRQDTSGITPFAMGNLSNQGATRTATGTAALVSELNANLDIFIKRYQRGFRKNLKILDRQVTELMPLGQIIRVQGMDGKVNFKEFKDRDVLRFDTDFDLSGNSANTNKAIERETAQLLLQLLQNPIALQAGIVSPQGLYEAYRNVMRKYDIRNYQDYIQSPTGEGASMYTAMDEINMILAGVKPPITLQDNHAQKLTLFEQFENSDEFGYFTEAHIPLYLEVKQAHQQYADAVAAQAQVAGASGGAVNPALAAQIAAGAGNPGGGVAQQIGDLMPQGGGAPNA